MENQNINPIVVTNQNADKIKVKTVFDVKFNMWRVNVKLKKCSHKKERGGKE